MQFFITFGTVGELSRAKSFEVNNEICPGSHAPYLKNISYPGREMMQNLNMFQVPEQEIQPELFLYYIIEQ